MQWSKVCSRPCIGMVPLTGLGKGERWQHVLHIFTGDQWLSCLQTLVWIGIIYVWLLQYCMPTHLFYIVFYKNYKE